MQSVITKNIIVVEDQQEHLDYLITILHCEPSFRIVGKFSDGLEALKLVPEIEPDVVIFDIGLKDISGIECIRQLSDLCPNTLFMACTVFEEDQTVFDALKAGARGYIIKSSKPYQIIDAVKDLIDGGTPISSTIAGRILKTLPGLNKATQAICPEEQYGITQREKDILHELSMGSTYDEIAEKLFLSLKTVKWHVHNIYRKLHAKNRMEAINRFFPKA